MTRQDFQKILQKNHEDMLFIKQMEQSILSKRPYVFRIPKAGQPVILLLSGGIDSVVTWEKLLGEYHLHVYPVTASRGFFDPQQRAIRFFSAYFQQKYPALYHQPVAIHASLLDERLYGNLYKNYVSPKAMLQQYDVSFGYLKAPYSGTNAFTAILGAIHAQYLRLTKGVTIHTIIYGANADDGLYISTQTYAFMRLMTRMLMVFVEDLKLQMGSVFYEASLGAHAKKREVLKYGHDHHLPLSRTFSCARRGIWHCGTCPSCIGRQYCFSINRIPDQTVYLHQLPLMVFTKKVVRRMKKLIPFEIFSHET